MKKQISILKFEIISTIFILVLGFILHFTYDWSGDNPIVGIFSAVNESVWEHLKLLFFPMLITGIVGSLYYKEAIPNYLCVKTKGILLGLVFIVVFFYTYTGVLGTNLAFLDIGSFFVAVLLGEYYTYYLINSFDSCNNIVAIIILFVLSLMFLLFTFFPPSIGIFTVPVSCFFTI